MSWWWASYRLLKFSACRSPLLGPFPRTCLYQILDGALQIKNKGQWSDPATLALSLPSRSPSFRAEKPFIIIHVFERRSRLEFFSLRVEIFDRDSKHTGGGGGSWRCEHSIMHREAMYSRSCPGRRISSSRAEWPVVVASISALMLAAVRLVIK